VPETDTEKGQRSTRTPLRALRKLVHDILEDNTGGDGISNFVNGCLITLIITNVTAFAAGTVPSIEAKYGNALHAFNFFSVIVFTVEYMLRLWSCIEMQVSKNISPFRARLRYAIRPLQIIDLIAILPFYLAYIFSLDLRVLRVFRLFRFLKIARYSPALHSLGRVIASERRALLGALLVMAALLLFASTGIYYLERAAQPDVYGSIPASAWWALATLTTVGYGDMTPLTPWGKMFGGLIMIFGLGMFALPIAIIATGFSQESNRREFVVTWGMVAKVPIFAKLEAAGLSSIIALLYSRSFAAGMRIFHIGENADAMYFITSGEVSVETDKGPVVLGEGDFFGEMALLDHRKREHVVTAITKCRVLVLDRADFIHLGHKEPELLDHISRVAKERIKDKDPKRSA